MLDPKIFVSTCRDLGARYAVGVPDSVLKEFAWELETQFGAEHKILANEGSAVAYAIGKSVMDENPGIVYMQNSGLGNALNPLVSLADPSVFGAPMVLIIGWRGELDDEGLQKADEPQHNLQGRVTPVILEQIGIPTWFIDKASQADHVLTEAFLHAKLSQSPVALLVRKDSFSSSEKPHTLVGEGLPAREAAISSVLEGTPSGTPTVAATGMIGRELGSLKNRGAFDQIPGLLVVGGMGHASSIASAIADSLPPGQKVLCLDGDGGLLMHMGALPHVAKSQNLVHVVLNNGVHDSVGGQKTVAREIALPEIARASGYGEVFSCSNLEGIAKAIRSAFTLTGNSFVEILCAPGHSPNLGRPKETPSSNFDSFRESVRKTAE